ncbi:hypothetical protein GN316_06970 [Xylophilus sp. Kf1]|nr:hypothetical protein [Xylophilus sp. Kf1]
MQTNGSFTSEVYVDGANFHFDAQFTRFLWCAQIRHACGSRFAWVSCVPPRMQLTCDTVEDAIAEWVSQTVTCCLDKYQGAAAEKPVEALTHTDGDRTSANSSRYAGFELHRNPETAPPLPETGRRALSQVQQLHRQSKAVIQKFRHISSEYDALRREIDVELQSVGRIR